MEYPVASAGSLPSSYQHSQEQSHISPGCNVQPSGSAFSVSDVNSHNRAYASYPQSYQATPDYAVSHAPQHAPGSSYSPGFPAEGHGQSLTLNQLLQQGNSPGGYQSRPQGGFMGAAYRSYEQFSYGYKPGTGNGPVERPQTNVYSYANAMGHRYPDSYVRSPYTGYPPSSAYSYYQSAIPQQISQRHPAVSHPSVQADFSTPMSSATSPRPTQSVTPVGAPGIDRPPSRGLGVYANPNSMSPAPQLSSPGLSTSISTISSSIRQSHIHHFGSPQQLPHGLAHAPQIAGHRNSRESQQTKSLIDSSIDTQGSTFSDNSYQVEESSPLSHPRLNDNSKSLTLNSPGNSGTFRESVEEQAGRNAADSRVTGSIDNLSSNAAPGIHESCSPSGLTNLVSASSMSPNHNPQSTPPLQSPITYSQSLPSANSPALHVTQTSASQSPPGSAGSPRLPCAPGHQFRPYNGSTIQSSTMPRHLYPPGPLQNHPPNVLPVQTPGQPYIFSNRAPPYSGNVSGYPSRPVGGIIGSGPPRQAQFSSQSGAIMPPPAAPPPNTTNLVSGSNLPSQQQPGFGASGSYLSPSTASLGGSPGPSNSSNWEPHASFVGGGVPGGPVQQQQSFGRSPSLYSGSSERGSGYSSPQSIGGIAHGSAASGVSVPGGPPQQPSASNSPMYHQPPVPSQYHSQTSPYNPHSYSSSGSTMSSTQPVPAHNSVPSSVYSANSGIPSRDSFHVSYSYSPTVSDRGPPPFFIASASSGLPSEPTFGSSSSMGITRMSTMGPGGITKINQSGMMKSSRLEAGMRPSTPNHLSNMPMGAQSGFNPNVVSGSAMEECPSNAQHATQQSYAMLQHSNQAAVHSFPGGWSESSAPNQINHTSVQQGPLQFSSFPHQHQQVPHYRPVTPPQIHSQYAHGLINPSSGGPVYGGSLMPHSQPHLHGMIHGISPQSSSGFQKLLEMGNEPERRPWLEHYIRFMEDIGKPLVGLPQVVKQPLDLYRFYLAVRERGGVLEVIKARRWKEISQLVNINASASAAYTLRKNYCKFLLDYECRFDRGGADPRPILMHIEAMSGKKKKPSPGDVEPGTNSLPGLQIPAPPSPTGSHSSASSSLLPPGSGSASLSGVPTTGSGASDSQLGPPQSRVGDSFQSSAGITSAENVNGLPSSPAPSTVSGVTPFISGVSMSSPQRPGSAASVANGYGSASQGTSDGCSTRPWPWSSDAGTVGISQHSPSVTVNGFPSSPMNGSTASQAMYPFDSIPRSHRSESPLLGKGGLHSFGCISASPLVSSSSAVSSGNGPPTSLIPASSAVPTVPQFGCKGPEPTVHHHPGSIPQQVPGAALNSMLPQHMHASPLVPGPPQPSLHPRLCSSMMNVRQPYLVNGPPGNTGITNSDPVAFLCMQQYRPSTAGHVSAYPQSGLPPFPGNVSASTAGLPAHLIHHHGQRPGYVATILKRVEHYSFPHGSIEATQIDSTRRRRYRSKDVGPVGPFKLLMALRSGLTAEVAWALNCLNILLRDETGSEFLGGVQLPLLVTNLVDLWRHSLGEIFNHDLFISTLELPANLNTSERLFRDLPSEKRSRSIALPKSMAGLEQHLLALAAKRNVSVTSLRQEIKRSLHKGSESTFWFPSRLRNGLVARCDAINTTTTSITPANMSTSSDPIIPSTLRTRKRGKPLTTNLSGNLPTSVSTNTSSMSSFMTAPLSLPKSDLNGVIRIVTTSTGLGTPQSFANLIELGLFALDTLTPHSPTIVPNAKRSSVFGPWNPARTLQDLLAHGGGDTTCHIMPPFGASSFPSKHWCGELSDLSKAITVNTDFVDNIQRPDSSSTPPPVVLKEKCTPRDETNCERDDLTGDDDEAQPFSKRARRTSTSSLGCPVLSPQPLDEPSREHDGTGAFRSRTSSSPVEVKQETCITVEDNDNEFSQLVMDAEGRCPLRAREELVYHGFSCLWPNDPDTDGNEARAVRCLCVSTVLRNLSFVCLTEHHLSSHKALLSLIGRVMLLGHDHVGPTDTWQTVELKAKRLEASLCAWRTPSWLEDMRENALVLLVNIAGYLNLINFEESIVRPILEGLLHWIICPTAASADPFPGHRTLSPRRLALEAVNRLSVHQSNVDLLLATPNVVSSDLAKLFDRLANWLSMPEDQVTRELALSTMHYLTGGGIPVVSSIEHVHGKASTIEPTSSSVPVHYIGTTMLAVAKPCPISGLLAFIEAAEATTRRVIEQFGVQALQERPELMGTSLEMVRRAGALLDRLAADPTGRKRFTPGLELRLLDLVTSRVLDATVAHLLCGALHRLSISDTSSPTTFPSPIVPPCPSLATVTQLLTKSEVRNSDRSSDTRDSFSLPMIPSEHRIIDSESNLALPDECTFESGNGGTTNQDTAMPAVIDGTVETRISTELSDEPSIINNSTKDATLSQSCAASSVPNKTLDGSPSAFLAT